jgi:cobalt-zinc-cadmium efflux system membrane fusion protein
MEFKIKYNIYKRFFYSTLLCFGVLLAGCLKDKSTAKTKEAHNDMAHDEMVVELSDEQFKVANIKLGKVETKTLSNVLEVNGTLSVPPQNLISISAPYGGFVKSTKLLQGTKVKKGEVLVVMEAPNYVQLQQDYIEKKGTLEYLALDFKRQEELQKGNINAAKQYQQAKSQYITIKAQVKGLQEKLSIIGIDAEKLTENNISSKIQIHSPINGYVSEVNVNIGKYVNPTDIMFEIINTEHLHVELTVFEKDIDQIKIDQKIKFFLPNKGSVTHNASIYLIGRKIGSDRSVRVHGHLVKEDKELLPGMFVNAEIELEQHSTTAISKEAIVFFENKRYVFILEKKDNKKYYFKMTEVQIGATENGYTEISFNEEDITIQEIQVATSGAYSLLAALKNKEEAENGH